MPIRRHLEQAFVAVIVTAVAVLGLSTPAGAVDPGAAKAAPKATDPSGTLNLGYFDNVTHGPALVALQGGLLQKALGSNVTLKTSIFASGTPEITAILSGAIDAAYIGPGPAVTAYTQSHGAVQVVSGVASGGAYFVVKPNITKAPDLKGKTVASPGLANTQDIALRSWLKKQGLKTDVSGGGDVIVRPQDNAITLQTFQQGLISGAWVPEQWATRLIKEGGGHVLVDEATLWPEGKYATTELIVRTEYLKAHADIVQRLIQANVEAADLITKAATRTPSESLAYTKIQSDTGKAVSLDLIAASFDHITFTPDPVATSLQTSAKNTVGLGLPGAVALTTADLKKLVNLKLLNKVLKARDTAPIATP
jgi:NitT/TauT family transport system substrate-binding protein